MATAKKCDRCGSYYDNNRSVKVKVQGDTYLNGVASTTVNGFTCKRYDLCDNCVEDFMRFIAGAGLQEE